MIEIMTLLSRLLFKDMNPLAMLKGPLLIRLMANMAAFFFLVFGYVLGCRVLYHYLIPFLGELLSLLAICGVLLITSFVLFIIAWFLKPKASPTTNIVSHIEKTISSIPTDEIIKKVSTLITPKAVVAIFTVAAIASYLTNFKKKHIES